MDKKFQDKAGKFARDVDRRSFLNKVMASLAGVIALFILGPFAKNLPSALAAPGCSPPNTRDCQYCSPSGCPAGYEICTKKNQGGCNWCIYDSGWWYGWVGSTRYKCFDCKRPGPVACSTICGCRVPG